MCVPRRSLSVSPHCGQGMFLATPTGALEASGVFITRSRLFAAWPASPRDAQRSRAEARKRHCAALPEAWTRTRCQRDDVTYALLHLYSQPMHKAEWACHAGIARIGEPGIRRA